MHEVVLVTGGCGFIGANLVPRLAESGYSVRVLDNFSRGRLEFINTSDFEFVEGDIRDEECLNVALRDVAKVVHLAAYGSVVESVADPVDNYQANVLGTFTLLNECRRLGVEKVVFASTGGALIGNAPPPVDENSVPRPISPYGASKLCCEAYCSAFAGAYDMKITALRFANVVGPISWHKKGAVTAFMKCILNQEPLTIYGDGSASRDFLYVDDLCSGIESALETEIPGFAAIHLASGREITVRELAELVLEVAGMPSDYPINYLDQRAGEVDRNFARFDVAKKLLGFSPSTPLEEGLEKTWQWFKSYHSSSTGQG